MEKEFYIKKMVCRSCIKLIRKKLNDEGFNIVSLELGILVIETENPDVVKHQLREILKKNDFDLIENPEEKLVEQIKILLIQLVGNVPENHIEIKMSKYLSDKLAQDYASMSKIFSYIQEITIEKYFIKLKIEKVKELIHSQNYNFTEISHMLGYSNLGHLSMQFKNETGVSLSHYKSMGLNFRNSLDRIL